MTKKQNDQTNAIANRGDAPALVFKRDLNNNRRSFAALIGVPEDSQTFISWLAEVSHVVTSNPRLIDANRETLMMALRHALTLGLSINPALGEAYLIPRWDKKLKCEAVQCQTGYRGMLALLHRSGAVDSVFADVIYHGENYKIRGGTSPAIEHEPDVEGDSRTNNFEDIVVAYATVLLRGSTQPIFVYLTRKDLARARAMNLDRDGNPSVPWRDHTEEMAQKVALARVCKMLPRHSKLADLHRALAAETQELDTRVSVDEAEQDDNRWEVACQAFAQMSVSPEDLLAFLGINSGGEFTQEHEAGLKRLYNGLHAQDPAALKAIEQARASVVDVEATDAQEPDA